MSVPFMGTELETTASKQQELSCWAHTGCPVALLGWTLTTRLCTCNPHAPAQPQTSPRRPASSRIPQSTCNTHEEEHVLNE